MWKNCHRLKLWSGIWIRRRGLPSSVSNMAGKDVNPKSPALDVWEGETFSAVKQISKSIEPLDSLEDLEIDWIGWMFQVGEKKVELIYVYIIYIYILWTLNFICYLKSMLWTYICYKYTTTVSGISTLIGSVGTTHVVTAVQDRTSRFGPCDILESSR